jgi:hypothetical protein
MTNLILGIIDNYTYHDISIFLLSLKAVNYDGHVCLFAGPNIEPRTIRRINELGIEVISYKKDFPFIADPHPDNFGDLPKPIHIYNFRHYLYYDYLLRHHRKFSNVLITDVKDVVFQKDPFGFGIEQKIYVAVENPEIRISGNPWTAKWILKGYDEATLSSLNDKEVICAGTTLAPTPLMMGYLKRLITEFFRVKNAYKCADQAMHNVIIHTEQVQPFHRCYNFHGPMLTLDTQADYLLNGAKELVNKDGSVVPIVHQYDRHPELLDAFVRKHKASRFWVVTMPSIQKRVKKIKRKLKLLSK